MFDYCLPVENSTYFLHPFQLEKKRKKIKGEEDEEERNRTLILFNIGGSSYDGIVSNLMRIDFNGFNPCKSLALKSYAD